jgi:hypothetical protein
MGRTACTEPRCLYKVALYLFYLDIALKKVTRSPTVVMSLCVFTTDLTPLDNL